ncbi:MAG TPA: transcriptional regulator [Candidatus Binatia bacterium]|nr:transcriptional regulator [Candidatus Binatia bacterium]
MHRTTLSLVKLTFCAALLLSVAAFASDWRLIGPDGGDVRSLAYDPANPARILLGTSAGQMFVSDDGGSSWSVFTHLGPGDDYVLDHIIFDPAHPATIYVAGWSLYNADEGDVFRSDDGGRNWRALAGVHGKSVRALAMAPSDPSILVAGALDGVFRSRDGGRTWGRISPENHAEIKNIESLAIDPQNPDVIYAGTWHLPWKTDDGGLNWHSISHGIAFDSDMFSIIVDPHSPATVYASACSGMYKSLNRAELFHRILGLPHSAMRTRVLKQDPQRPSIVYAGTTGGLWKSLDGGNRWKLVSDDSVIVNDVLVDPRDPDHVLVATDRGGVLASHDGFRHYESSNRGFAHRVIGGVVVDVRDPGHIYAGVVNDKDLGGFFFSEDGGATWQQSNHGLDERDILSLQQAPDGVIFAGTNHGVFYLTSLHGEWQPAEMIRGPLPPPEEQKTERAEKPASSGKSARPRSRHTAVAYKAAAAEHAIPPEQTPRIRAINLDGDLWYAATNEGLFLSADHGRRWYGTMVGGENDFIAINTFADGSLSLVSPRRAFLSHDAGKSWSQISYPQYVTALYNLTAVPDGSLWLATREGALHSTDGGRSWEHTLGGLPARNILVVLYDAPTQRLLSTALYAHGVFESRDGGRSWQRTADTGVSIRAARSYQGRLLATSSYNGLLLEKSGDTAGASETANVGVVTSTASRD